MQAFIRKNTKKGLFSRMKVGAEVKVGLAEMMMIGSRSIEIAATVVLCTYVLLVTHQYKVKMTFLAWHRRSIV